MDREEQELRTALRVQLERIAPEPDDAGALENVVRKGRAFRRRRQIVRAGTVVAACALVALAAFGTISLARELRDDPEGGGWSNMGAPAAGSSVTSTSAQSQATVTTYPAPNPDYHVSYTNTQYGFAFYLPESWRGLTVLTQHWEGQLLGYSDDVYVPLAIGPEIVLRHPLWTETEPRQDIPIMVFTLDQWESVLAEKLGVGAAPIPPSELGRNSSYVFALPARYNFAFQTGFEEVEQILSNHPWQPLPSR